MNRIKDDLGQRLNSVEDHLVDINKKILATQSVVERSLNESIRTVNDNIEEYKSQTDSDLHALNMSLFGKIDTVSSRINVSMREEFRAVERQFQEHKNQTTSELSDLHTSLQSTIHSPPTEVMSDAVLYKLLPYINKLNASVRAMRHQIQEHKNWTFELSDMHTSLQSSISAHVNQQSEICDKMDIIGSKMDRINVSLREEFEKNFEEHKNQTISELSDLHTSLQSTHTDHLTQICDKMDVLNSRMINVSSANNGTIDSKLDLLDSKQDELDMKVMSINTQLEHNILTNITKQLQKTSESSHEALGPCGGEGWRRVAYLDMTHPNTTCPSGWQLGTRGSKRTCDRFSTGSLTCDSVFFPVSGGAYTTVCGRIRAYQYSSTDAFESYHDGQATTIDEAYVCGVSLTHGSPRQHIWTFAAGITEAYRNQEDACPCDDTVAISIPPFVGEDYFCESGDHSGSETWGGFHLYDPLWDGQNCTSTSTCCSFNNPPYFTKRLPSPTTDDLEARLCLLDSGNDAPIEFIELYVGLGEVNTKALHQNVLSNTQKLTHMISSKMELINVSMREEFRAVERQFQEHKNQTASELSDLHTSLQSTHTDHLTQICAKMDGINLRIISVSSANNSTIDSKLDLLDSKQDELNRKVMSVNSELEHNILTNITKQLQKTSESLHEALGPCGGEGWRRVAYLDMTHPNTTCPSGWQLGTRGSKRTCDRFSTGRLTCDSVFFPVIGGAYTSVCGRIRAYQYSSTDAFESYHDGQATTIDEAYVSGVSLTHGSPRQHVWTFAAGITEADPTREDACPCDDTVTISIPPFVGEDYFCESGTNSGSSNGFHPYDPLWDGQNCTSTSRCCSFNNPPYFTKQLPSPTTDDIEVRLCQYDGGEDAPIEFIELYVGLDEQALYQNVLSNTQQLTDMISSKMELINVSMREEFRAVERQFQEHKNQTTSELSDLHTSLQSTHTDHLTQICAKMDGINSRIISVSSANNSTIDSKLDLLDSKQTQQEGNVCQLRTGAKHID